MCDYFIGSGENLAALTTEIPFATISSLALSSSPISSHASTADQGLWNGLLSIASDGSLKPDFGSNLPGPKPPQLFVEV